MEKIEKCQNLQLIVTNPTYHLIKNVDWSYFIIYL